MISMRTKDQQLHSLPKTNIKSTVMFRGVFSEEIEKTIEILSDYLEENLEKDYSINYVDVWTRNIKIKIHDEDKFIFKTINCVFDYTSVDQKYWNTRVELAFTELSQKPRHYLVWKFNVLERDKINNSVLKMSIKWLEEIFE